MKTVFPKIEALPLPDRISRLIQQAIMKGSIRPGERINTYKLARQFKVSHIPVREALKKLEAVGIVVPEANKSARVIEFSAEDIQHIFEVRQTLEGLAAYLAAERIDPAHLKKLEAAVKIMRQSARSNNFVRMFAADKKFHETMWNLSGNPFLIKTLDYLLLPYFGFLASSGYYAHLDDLSYVPRVHQELLQALSSKDGKRARRVIVGIHRRSVAMLLPK